MYNVLIADDEIEVREGLKLKVDWEEIGFRITGEASNGLEAKSLLASRRYDLLVTDMNMPVMDGVGLLDICRHNSPSLQVIIITGYEDFQYARAGVRNQAMDYLLKPVTRDDLKSALIKIKHALDKERVVRDESETMQWQLSQYYKEMKERFLLDLVKGKQLPISSIPERVRLFDLDAWQEQEVCFVTAGMQDAKQEPSELGRTPVQLRLPFQMVCHEIAQTYHQTIQIFHDPAYPGFMHFVAIGGTQRVFAERLKQQANSYLNIDVQISIGQPVKGFSAWKEGYMYALLAWNVEIRHSGPGAVGGRTAVADRSPLLPEETSRILQKCLSKGDLVTFRLMIRQELREAARISPSRLVRSIFQISLLMETAAAEFIGYTPERAPIWSSPEWALILETPDQAEGFLMQMAADLVSRQQAPSHPEITRIDAAKRYIEENYMQELTLTSLAEQYNYHPTYFSEMFKEEAGVSFIQYVTEVRMKQAVRLLTETQLTVWDIAELAGFSSPSYFSSKFKKMFHMSPTDYRSKQSEEIDGHDPKK